MVFVRRVSTSRARRIDKEEALCRYASRFFFSRGFLALFQSGTASSSVEACPSTVARIGNAARVVRGGREAAGIAGW